jgi:hypothetical protein
MMFCNSQASFHNPGRVDPSRSVGLALGTSQTHVVDDHINPLPIVGPMHISDAALVTRAPPTHPSHAEEVQAQIPSPRLALTPTAIIQRENSTINDIIQEVIQVTHSTHTPLEPLTVVPSSPLVQCYCEGVEDVEGDEVEVVEGDDVEDVEGEEVEVVEGKEHVEGEHVQGDRLQNQEASTPAVEVVQTMPPTQASTSAVNVVPLDASNP